MEPETRTLFDAESEVADAYVQEPMPWCTTHDQKWESVSAIMEGCWAGSQLKPCVDKSTGGPDHKWWKDT